MDNAMNAARCDSILIPCAIVDFLPWDSVVLLLPIECGKHSPAIFVVVLQVMMSAVFRFACAPEQSLKYDPPFSISIKLPTILCHSYAKLDGVKHKVLKPKSASGKSKTISRTASLLKRQSEKCETSIAHVLHDLNYLRKQYMVRDSYVACAPNEDG